MGMFNVVKQAQNVVSSEDQPANNRLSLRQRITSGNQHTETVENPLWEIVICTIRLDGVRISTTLHRKDINVAYRVSIWGDILSTTTNWRYQYVAEVLLVNPTDNSRVTLKFQKAGYYTWGSAATPSSWSIRDDNDSYCIESFHVL